MKIAVTGGIGFVGRTLCRRLEQKGYEPIILSRRVARENASWQQRQVDYHCTSSLGAALGDCTALIHLVGILHEAKGQSFAWAHHGLVTKVVAAAAAVGVRDYLHMSALGAGEYGPSRYLSSKASGEASAFAACRENGMRMIAFRPSLIFGEKDHFRSSFERLLRYFPGLPIVCPEAEFQPVAVEDVADALLYGLESSEDQTVFELGGAETLSMLQLVQLICARRGWRRLLIPLPDWASASLGRSMNLVPGAPFRYDNYLSMRKPNTTEQWPWPRIGIEPQSIRDLL